MGFDRGRSMIAMNMTGLSAVGRKLRLWNRLFEADVDFEVLTNCYVFLEEPLSNSLSGRVRQKAYFIRRI